MRKLQRALQQLSESQNSNHQQLTEAKLRTSIALRNFHYSALFIKSESLKEMFAVEQQVLQYGQTVTERQPWCWENNLPLLEGATGWAGNGFGECASKLIRQLKDVVGWAYGRLEGGGDDVVNKYRLLEVFERRNIISDAAAISKAIDEVHLSGSDFNLDFGAIIAELREELDGMLLLYDSCLGNVRTVFEDRVNGMKQYTAQCLKDL